MSELKYEYSLRTPFTKYRSENSFQTLVYEYFEKK